MKLIEESGLEFDVVPENWLQELISTRVNGSNSGPIPEYNYNEYESISECTIRPEQPSIYCRAEDAIPNSFEFPRIQFDSDFNRFQSSPSMEQIDTLDTNSILPVQWYYESTARVNQLPFPEPWLEERASSTNTELDDFEARLLVRTLLARSLIRIVELMEGLKEILVMLPKTSHLQGFGITALRACESSAESTMRRLAVLMQVVEGECEAGPANLGFETS